MRCDYGVSGGGAVVIWVTLVLLVVVPVHKNR